ncbi:MAG: D-alanyl-D-alanine carboxypeptidase/D-alanyl-D-alanine-endopeptidase [Chlamydiales bacterium]|nr:D-alanyl-D-alanine carboxypeptidase/D-alanyl-D-alanine-endopeptidase [Chlamydiales bacterium]
MLKGYLFCLVGLCLPIFGLNRDQLTLLKNDIDRIIYRQDQTATIGIDIVNLHTGEHLYERNRDHRLIPGGCIKLFTLAAAYEYLGIDHQFETSVFSDGEIENGVVYGNIYLKGSGDPTLVSANLDDLAHQLSVLGIREIKGKLIVDASGFDSMATGPGWAWGDVKPDISVPSALSINQSCCDLWIRPGVNEAAPAEIISDIPLNQLSIKIDNQTLTLSKSKKDTIEITQERKNHKSTLHVMGQLALKGSPTLYKVPVENPPMMAGMTMQTLMHGKSIQLRGEIKEGITPPKSHALASCSSGALVQIGQMMCKNDNDYYAHCLLKTLGQHQRGTPGTWQSGSSVIRNFAAENIKIDPKEIALLDGSGLSRYNLISPAHMTRFLSWAYNHSQYSHELLSALSIAGIDGSLKTRLIAPHHKGRIRGMAGSMKGISSFTGICWCRAKEPIAVTIVINNSVKPEKELDTQLIDPICALITEL